MRRGLEYRSLCSSVEDSLLAAMKIGSRADLAVSWRIVLHPFAWPSRLRLSHPGSGARFSCRWGISRREGGE